MSTEVPKFLNHPLTIKRLRGFGEMKLESGEVAILRVPKGGSIYMDSLGPCVGFVGYNLEKKVIFGIHLYIHGRIDHELAEFMRRLNVLGLEISDCAVAGGNLSYADKLRGANYVADCTAAKRGILQSRIRSYMDPSELTEESRCDYLSVKYEDGSFSIEFQRGSIDEELEFN